MKLAPLVALALAISAASVDAGVLPRDAVVNKERVAIPRGWIKRSAVDDNTPATFRVALARRNIDEVENKIQELSDPDSSNYAKWLSKDQLNSIIAPSAKARAAVADWLEQHGVSQDLSRRSETGDSITVRTTYGKARDLLGSQFHTYEHRRTGEIVVRTEEINLPRSVAEHIDLVSPSTNFGAPRSQKSTIHINGKEEILDATSFAVSNTDVASEPDSEFPHCQLSQTTLQCIQEIYKTPNITHREKTHTKFAIAGYLEEWANYKDYHQYKERLAPYALNYAFDTQTINGGTNNQSVAAAGGEAGLDVQAALLGFPIPLTYYSVGGRGSWVSQKDTPSNTNEPYEALYDYLLSLPDEELPSVLSNSYDDDEFSVAPSYAHRVCQDILLLGVRGTSVLFSSGDDGVGSDNDCSIDGKPHFLPEFPSTCPYATSVGATENYGKKEQAVGATVAGFYSGGGFSSLFKRPWYQKEKVDPYVASLDPALKPYYWTEGRGVPDVAAQGSRYLIRTAGQWGLVGGTSASAPTFASVVALLNEARAQKGIPTLGFLNPLLYKKGFEGLNDITVGSSQGCVELGAPASHGFPAAEGWDAVTGLGTPDYEKLEKIVTYDL